MEFKDLANKYTPTIKRIAYKLNGRYRSFDHDDLCQEAMLHLWNNFRWGKLRDKTDSYILQGCYFHLKNYIRKVNEKSNMLSIEAAIWEGQDTRLEELISLNTASDLREDLNNKFLSETIQNNGFNLREKQILKFCAEGLTTRDIGKRIGVSHVMVVKLLKELRKKCGKYRI